jgi:hypothetical protein
MIAQLGQPLLDGREEGPACQDLSGEDRRWPARGGGRERSAIGVHDRLGQRPSANAGGQDALDEEVAVQDEPAADRAAEQP